MNKTQTGRCAKCGRLTLREGQTNWEWRHVVPSPDHWPLAMYVVRTDASEIPAAATINEESFSRP